MDIFDLSASSLRELGLTPPPPAQNHLPAPGSISSEQLQSSLTSTSHSKSHPPPPNPPPHLSDLAEGMRPLSNTPVLILGVQSDILFPVEQQREMADA